MPLAPKPYPRTGCIVRPRTLEVLADIRWLRILRTHEMQPGHPHGLGRFLHQLRRRRVRTQRDVLRQHAGRLEANETLGGAAAH